MEWREIDWRIWIARGVQLACLALGVGVTMVLIEAAPAAWFRVFEVLGPGPRPWLMGAAAILATIPTLVLPGLVLKLLRLPPLHD